MMAAWAVICVGGVFIVQDQMGSVAADVASTSARVKDMIQENNDLLRTLNKEMPKDCRDSTLQQIRRLFVHLRYVSDAGVLNEAGSVVCTASLGVLPSPVSLGAPDFSRRWPSGEELKGYNQRSLPGQEGRSKTTITLGGSFYVALPGDIVQEVVSTNRVRAVLAARLDGSWIKASAAQGLPELRVPRFDKVQENPPSTRYYDSASRTYIQFQQVPGTMYALVGVATLSQFLAAYYSALVLAVTAAVIVAVLVFYAVLPVFKRWGTLAYRIHTLLQPEHLVCMYQPILDMKSGQVVGCEVLMRLRDRSAVIPPDIALPAIIGRGLTWNLDQLVVEVAVAELAGALPEVEKFKVAFNFFPQSVGSGGVADLFARVQAATPHPGLLFDVEVLEQEYKDSMIQAVAELRQRQILISVDDFGTGFSNLGSVRALQPDFLKIDRSFVKDMESSSVRSTLIPEIVAIGRAVGAQLIAEGIENAEQYALLQAMGIEYGQGYYLSRPLAIEKFADFVRTRRPTA